jgi:hypothetical protein
MARLGLYQEVVGREGLRDLPRNAFAEFEPCQPIGRGQIDLDPRFPVGSEFSSEFFLLGADSAEPGANLRSNFRALRQIPCPAWAGNSFCPRRESFMGGQGILRKASGLWIRDRASFDKCSGAASE